MPADRISPAQLRSAVRYNAGRRNWQVKPGGKYPNRASPKLAEDVFTYQMIANAIGPRITADGKLGPQTAARSEPKLPRQARSCRGASGFSLTLQFPGESSSAQPAKLSLDICK